MVIKVDDYEKSETFDILNDKISIIILPKSNVICFALEDGSSVIARPSGTLHAIGEGILIAEVQQNSNTTYRVSDYGRLGIDGKPRVLHIDKALDVTSLEIPKVPYGNIGEIKDTDFGNIRNLAKCDMFTAKLINLKGKTEICCEDSFVSLVVLSGDITVQYNDEILTAKKGDSIFIPANIKAEINGNAELLYSKV